MQFEQCFDEALPPCFKITEKGPVKQSGVQEILWSGTYWSQTPSFLTRLLQWSKCFPTSVFVPGSLPSPSLYSSLAARIFFLTHERNIHTPVLKTLQWLSILLRSRAQVLRRPIRPFRIWPLPPLCPPLQDAALLILPDQSLQPPGPALNMSFTWLLRTSVIAVCLFGIPFPQMSTLLIPQGFQVPDEMALYFIGLPWLSYINNNKLPPHPSILASF